MKAIRINSVDRKIEEIEIGDYRDITKQIGGRCTIFTTGGYLPNGDVVYVDDEGLINGTRDFFYRSDIYPTPLAGNAVVLGSTPYGDSRDARSTAADFANVKFLDIADVVAAML